VTSHPPQSRHCPCEQRTGKLRMPEIARLRALEERHAVLEARIADEDNRPRPDADQLFKLKREKLRLKEEMERLKGHQLH
jgi:hypothetical protein